MNDFTLKGLDSFDYEYIDNDDKIYNDDNDDYEDKIETHKMNYFTLKGLDSFDSSLSLLSFSKPSCCDNQLLVQSEIVNKFNVHFLPIIIFIYTPVL